MAAPHLDDSVVKGTDYQVDLSFTDDDGDAVTIITSQYTAQLLDDINGTYITEFTMDDVDAEDPKVTLVMKLLNTDTGIQNYTGETLYWDLIRNDGTTIEVYMRGRLTVIDMISDQEAPA